MGVSDGEDDWNSESSEDDGDGAGCEDEVEEVIFSQHQQSVTVPNPFCFFRRETRTRKTKLDTT